MTPVRDNKHTCWIELTTVNGTLAAIRKAFKVLGYEVLTMVRTKIGDVALGALPIGSWKELTNDEITTLYGGKMPTHFGEEPTEMEAKVAAGEVEIKNDKTKAKEKKAAAAAANAPAAEAPNA